MKPRKPFRVKPRDAPRQEQTPAQEAATRRNFHIFRVRGLYDHACILSAARAQAMRDLIDDELEFALGVETMTARRARVWAAEDAALESADDADDDTLDLPF